ncbi:MAG: tRNA epoxyqueuosine(34) reductase QueG [Chromatiales bacterium]|nr:tRNA epoxyqueuosine(34) reductase QueG [Chromatiales bacterium]
MEMDTLADKIKQWAIELGFNDVGFANTELHDYELRLLDWLGNDMHGEMHFMEKHGKKRSRPEKLVKGTVSIISVRMNYLDKDAEDANAILEQPEKAYISRYALGRDYHKLIRKKLQCLADRITQTIGPFTYRAFSDSAPVLEKPLAEQAGLGWIGKHTLLLNRTAGSWFFLGELYTDLALPQSTPVADHCGSCTRCIDICPTQAIVAPYKLDARRCIAYLTIEFKGSIPLALRPLVGNRIFGCDDCQLVCPWNRYAGYAIEEKFRTQHNLDAIDLVELFAWSEQEFHHKLAGTAIKRSGYECWLRNIAVALGNAPPSEQVIQALKSRLHYPSEIVREHVQWAIAQHA